MLDPAKRNLLSSMLKPPSGYLLDRAIATTFSLDPLMAITVPLNLAAFDMAGDIKDVILLYDAICKVTDKIDIFLDKGRMLYPKVVHEMYSLLEPIIHETHAPNEGAFHPKCWLLRYKNSKSENDMLHRLIISSRNVTFDNSWDMCLCLDEDSSGSKAAPNQNEPIKRLFQTVINSDEKISASRREGIERLLNGLDTVSWEYPEGIEQIDFLLFGFDKHISFPSLKGYKNLVISPFCSDYALEKLVWDTPKEANILISRSETLDKLKEKTIARFAQVYTLGESELIEERENEDSLEGLHAKVMISNKGYDSTMYIGSANATDAAMSTGKNVEIMARLVGKRSKMGGSIDDNLLGLLDYVLPYQKTTVENEKDQKELLLEEIRRGIIIKEYKVLCEQKDEDRWEVKLCSEKPGTVSDEIDIYAWPITIKEVRQRRIDTSNEASIGIVGRIDITGLIAFRIEVDSEHVLKFVLNLPLINPPKDRESALINYIISNGNNFLRYIYLLVCSQNDGDMYDALMHLRRSDTNRNQHMSMQQLPLLEEMVRTLTKDRKAFYSIKKLVDKISETNDSLIPEDFKELWHEIEKVLETT